jgi:hypothetical protein
MQYLDCTLNQQCLQTPCNNTLIMIINAHCLRGAKCNTCLRSQCHQTGGVHKFADNPKELMQLIRIEHSIATKPDPLLYQPPPGSLSCLHSLIIHNFSSHAPEPNRSGHTNQNSRVLLAIRRHSTNFFFEHCPIQTRHLTPWNLSIRMLSIPQSP